MDASFLIIIILGVIAVFWWKASINGQNGRITAAEAGLEFTNFLDELDRTKVIPVQEDPAFRTQASEFIALRHPHARMMEIRTSRLSGWLGTRVKIAGVPLYLGASKSLPSDELRDVGEGILYLTNKRLMFMGSARTYASSIDNILNIENGLDWIRIQAARQTKPVTFTVPNGFFWEGMYRLMVDLRPDSPHLGGIPAKDRPSNASSSKQETTKGDASAQYDCGLRYYHGKGIEQDLKQAAVWFEKAAAQGHAGAQFDMGVMYATGQGVAQNYNEAASWHYAAAAQGYVRAQCSLGLKYLAAEGVPQDDRAALTWFERAAAQADEMGQFLLGLMYYQGKGVPQDYKQAASWFEKSAIQGNSGAQYNLGIIYFQGEGIAQDYKQAAYWFEKAAAQGHAGAQFNFGAMYYKGEGMTQDYKQAASWFEKAAIQGDAESQRVLGDMHEEGTGLVQDYIEAHKWLNIASRNGNAKALKNRDIVEGKMNREQIAEAQRRASEWVKASAKDAR